MGDNERPPEPWSQNAGRKSSRWLRPLYRAEWAFEWIACWLERRPLLKVLEHLGKLSLLATLLVFLFTYSANQEQARIAADDARKAKVFAALQALGPVLPRNAQGGLWEAVEAANRVELPLGGIQLAGTTWTGRPLDLTKVRMNKADLRKTELHRIKFDEAWLEVAHVDEAIFRECSFRDAEMQGFGGASSGFRAILCDFSTGVLPPRYGTNLTNANFTNSVFKLCDFRGANFTQVNLRGVRFNGCLLSGVLVQDPEEWKADADERSMFLSNIEGIDASEEFIAWAKARGAVELKVANMKEWVAWLEAHHPEEMGWLQEKH